MDESETSKTSLRKGWGDEPQLESHGTSWKQKVQDKEVKCFHITSSGHQNCCKDHWYSQYDCALHLAGSSYIEKFVLRWDVKFARHKNDFKNFLLESVNESGMKGSLAVDKYASKLTSLQEKFQVFPFFASTFSIDSDLPQSSRIPAQCSTQVSPSAQNMLGRPFPGWPKYLWSSKTD